MKSNLGKLSIVATPIGNLGDFSVRGKETLLAADIIVAEDTRTLRSLLPEEKIKATLMRGDAITEEKVSVKILDELEKGKHVALITDAGTPAISDPGYILVKKVRQELSDVFIEVIPGASALVAAISISGIPATPFTFFGFPPMKKGRLSFFKNIAELDHTAVLYESPHRFMKTLSELEAAISETTIGSSRTIFVGRELTKIHEEGIYGTIEEVITYYKDNSDKVRGEFVIVIQGK